MAFQNSSDLLSNFKYVFSEKLKCLIDDIIFIIFFTLRTLYLTHNFLFLQFSFVIIMYQVKNVFIIYLI